MTLPKTNRFLPWFCTALALIPAAMMAYLGHFSRMTYDDYCHIRLGQELGAWEATVYQFNTWTSKFVGMFMQYSFSFADVSLPSIWPALSLTLWVAAAWWLVWQGLAIVDVKSARMTFSLSIAVLAVAVCVNAFPSAQAFYWHTSNQSYSMPLAAITFTVALAAWTVQRNDTRLYHVGVVGVAISSFLSAGFSEMYLVSQVFLSTLFLIASPLLTRRIRFYALGVWIGTCVSLIIQLQSPGVLARMQHDQWKFGDAVLRSDLSLMDRLSSALRLIPEALEETLRYVGTEESFAGFVLLLCLGLLVALLRIKPGANPPVTSGSSQSTAPLWLLTISQVLFLPVLWSHSSDSLTFFGRFSPAYAIVIFLNIALLSGSIIAHLWFVARPSPQYRRPELVLGMLAAVCLILFALTQLRSIHHIAASYLFVSAIMTLGIITWMLAGGKANWKIALTGPFAYCFSVILAFVVVYVALLGRGFVSPRILTMSTTFLVLSGLAWGAGLGLLMRRFAPLDVILMRPIKIGCFGIICFIAASIALGKASHISAYARFASEWDDRHQRIIALRDAGEKNIVVAPLISASGFASAEESPGDTEHDCVKFYYGVESITESDSA